MQSFTHTLRALIGASGVLLALLGPLASEASAAEPLQVKLKVDDREREALVFLPAVKGDAPAPLVFGFHGHGGTARQASRSFRFHEVWPEAMVVYMQGIPTPGRLTDPEGLRNGWQSDVGAQGDRDLKFFDAALAWLRKEHPYDERRVYASGHSNGGAFTYVLWGARPEAFAAFAPSSGGARTIRTLKPKPALHVAGEKDPLVRIEGQRRVMDAVRRINGCEPMGMQWGEHATLYPSPTGTPFVTVIHPGDHTFYRDAPPLMVRFFKQHSRSEK